MKSDEEVETTKLPKRVEEILRAQPLNPFVRMEMKALAPSWSMIDQDKAASYEAAVVG